MTPLRRAARSAREFLSRKLTPDALKIGVSARLFHPQPDAKGIQSKTLQYLEQSVAHWVMSRDVLVFMVPTVDKDGLLHRSEVRLADYARVLDGLVLQGGADVSPSTYGEAPLAPQWAGDRLRDVYEMELVHEFIEAGKPVLGICRGAQLLNIHGGGTLHQDLSGFYTERPNRWTVFPRKRIVVQPQSRLRVTLGCGRCEVNSLHRQAVDALGEGLAIVACDERGVVQGIEHSSRRFWIGVQWHPEYLPQVPEQRRLFAALVAAARQGGR